MINVAMKMKASLAVMCTVFAALYQLEIQTDYWKNSDFTSVEANAEELFKLITNADHVEKWFNWISHLREADSRPLGVNKQYKAIYNIPYFGEYAMLMKIVDYEPRRKIILESNQLLRPQVEIYLQQIKSHETRMTMKINYRRYSILFHILIAPTLSLLTSQQIQHSLFKIRMFFPY